MSILPRCPKCWKMYCTGSHTGLCNDDKSSVSKDQFGQPDTIGQVTVGGCPCLYTTPCDPQCTCVNKFSSTGCSRCCAYGSLEQRTAQAVLLASNIDDLSKLKEYYNRLNREYDDLRSKFVGNK